MKRLAEGTVTHEDVKRKTHVKDGRLITAAVLLLRHRFLDSCSGAHPELLSELLPNLQQCSTCSLHRTITDLPMHSLKLMVNSSCWTMAKQLVHHSCYSSVTAVSSPCSSRVLVRGHLTISQALQEQKFGLHACSCSGIGLGTAAEPTSALSLAATAAAAVAAKAAASAAATAKAAALRNSSLDELHKADEGVSERGASGGDGAVRQDACNLCKDLNLQYELVLDASSWSVLEVSGSCCGIAWDPLRCQLCPGAMGLLLHARICSQQVFCESDLATVAASQHSDRQQPLTKLSMGSLQLGAPVTLPQAVAALSHGTLVATATACVEIQQTSTVGQPTLPVAPVAAPSGSKAIPDHPSQAPAMTSLMTSLLQPKVFPSKFLCHLITDMAGCKPHEDPAVAAGTVRSSTIDVPLFVEGAAMLQGDLDRSAVVSGCCMADEDAARWMLAHTPSVFTSAKNKALMATFHAAKAAAAASGATSTVPDPTLRGLFSVSKPADGGSGIQCADVMDESECSWHSRMTLLSTNPDTLAEDGIVQQGKQSVWPRVAMEAFSAVATKPFGPVGAVSSLMRAVWLCLHQYGFPARQTRLPLLLQALSRVLLCSSLPTYVQRAVIARLQHWHVRICTTSARRRVRADEYGGDMIGVTSNLLDHINACIQLARDGWDAPHVAQVLSQGTLSHTMTSQLASLCIPARLHWLQHFKMSEEYIQLACAAQCWSAAVKKLLQLGSRQDVQRGTQYAMAKLSSPAAKTDLAVFLLSQVSGGQAPVSTSGPLVELNTVEAQLYEIQVLRHETFRGSVHEASNPHPGPPHRLPQAHSRDAPAGQGQATEDKQGLPLALVLHAAARMVLSAARGIVMLPLPGVTELTEVVALRAESGKFLQLIRSVMATVRKRLDEEQKQQQSAWLEAVQSNQAQLPTPSQAGCMHANSTAGPAADDSHLSQFPVTGMSSIGGLSVPVQLTAVQDLVPTVPEPRRPQRARRTRAWLDDIVEIARLQLPDDEDVLEYSHWISLTPDLPQYLSANNFPVSAAQLVALAATAAAQRAAAPAAPGQQGLAEDRAMGTATTSAAASATASAPAAAQQAAALAAVQCASLKVADVCLVTDPSQLEAFSVELPVKFRDSAAVHSLAVQVVRSQVSTRLDLLISGEVVLKADHLEVMDSLEQLLGVFCEDSMLERVQLQAIMEIMVVAFCTALSSSRLVTNHALPLGNLALELAQTGQLGLAVQVAKLNHKLSSTIKAATQLLELSIAVGPEEQKRSCEGMFKQLWSAAGKSFALAAGVPAHVAAVVRHLPAQHAGLNIPRGRAGEMFAELWLEELDLKDRVEELEEENDNGEGFIERYHNRFRYGMYGGYDSDEDDENNEELEEAQQELLDVQLRKRQLGLELGMSAQDMGAMTGRDMYEVMQARALDLDEEVDQPALIEDTMDGDDVSEEYEEDRASVDTAALEQGETADTAQGGSRDNAMEVSSEDDIHSLHDDEDDFEEMDAGQSSEGGTGKMMHTVSLAVNSRSWGASGSGPGILSGSGSGFAPLMAAAVGFHVNSKGVSGAAEVQEAAGAPAATWNATNTASHAGTLGTAMVASASAAYCTAAAADVLRASHIGTRHDLVPAVASDVVDLLVEDGPGEEEQPPDDLVAVVAASSRMALSVCVTGMCPVVEYFAMAQFLKGRGASSAIIAPLLAASVAFAIPATTLALTPQYKSWTETLGALLANQRLPLRLADCPSQDHLLKGLPKDNWATFVACRSSPEVAANANPYATHPIMTHSRLEPLVAWILAAYSKQEDFTARVTMLKAVVSATEQRFGPQLLHLAVAMIRNGLVGEAMGVLSRGLLPRSALVRVLTERIPEFSACLFQTCLKEVAATLIPELGSPSPPLSPSATNAAAATATTAAVAAVPAKAAAAPDTTYATTPSDKDKEVIGDLVCNMVLMEIPMSQAMLSNKLCVTAALAMVNILWTKLAAGKQGEVDLFASPKAGAPQGYTCQKSWLTHMFTSCITAPLKLSAPQVQEFFMVCVAEMPDSTLSFKLKIPFLQWATHAAIPLHSIFPAAKKALREGLQAVSLHTTSQPSLYDQARGPAGMEFWLKDKQSLLAAAGVTAAEIASRRWVWQVLQWMTSKLGEAIPEAAAAANLAPQQPLLQQQPPSIQQPIPLQQPFHTPHALEALQAALEQQPLPQSYTQMLPPQQMYTLAFETLSASAANHAFTPSNLPVHLQGSAYAPELMALALQLMAGSQQAVPGFQHRQQLPLVPGVQQNLASSSAAPVLLQTCPYTPEMYSMAGELVTELGNFSGPELLPVAAAVLRLAAAYPWVGYGSSPWGTSHPPDGMLLLSRSILPLCGSWRKMSAGANVTWASKEYRDTLQDLVMSCSKGVTKVSQDLMVKLALTLFQCSPDCSTLFFVNRALLRACIITSSASAQPLIVPDQTMRGNPPSLNPSSEAMMFMHSILTPYLMATQPSNSEAKETGLIRLLQIQVLGQQGVGPALDLLFSRPAGMPLKQTIVLWLANLNHIIALPTVYKLFSSDPSFNFQRVCTCLGLKPRYAQAPNPRYRPESYQEAFAAISKFPGIAVAVHLIRVHTWCQSVLKGPGGVGAVLLRKDETTLMQQRGFVADVVAIHKINDKLAREIISSQERSVPGTAESLLCPSEALLLGSLPALTAAMGEVVKEIPTFQLVSKYFRKGLPQLDGRIYRLLSQTSGVTKEILAGRIASWFKVPELLMMRDQHLPWKSTVTGTKAQKALEIAGYIIDNWSTYIEQGTGLLTGFRNAVHVPY